jgi:FAD/FMN-containing dehydrogenase
MRRLPATNGEEIQVVESVEKLLSGWGNYCLEKCHVVRPESTAAISQTLVGGGHGTYIPRGLGRSYGDAAVNRDAGVIDQTRLNRFLSFDETTGMLECESGVTLGEIIEVFLPRGWFLPTTPGTKFVTIGGAIAADVHGKNHHQDGSFGNFVLRLQLATAGGEVITCSPSKNDDAFWATVGGMGLTGVILTARIQLVKVSTAYCRVKYKRTANLDESLECFAATDKEYR